MLLFTPETLAMKTFARTLLLSATLLAAPAFAAPAINTLSGGLFNRDTGVAIRGYDPVAYFTDKKPVKGNDAYSFAWKGATWKFASQAHLDLFKAQPEQYAPQYGGYCAYGVTKDYLVKIEPEAWAVVGGKLYLNYDADVQKTWALNPAGYIKTADGKFSSLLKK
jgi:YHS domain-containing protein